MKNNLLVKGVSIATVLTLGVITASPVLAYTKDETVYGKMSNSGENYNTVVSTHLKNTENESILKDISDLLNIKNINGDETFEVNENILKWNSNGNDIYYQGDTEKKLPLECTIKYELDGNEISAEELAGKSGKIKITIEYKNKDEHIVKINGKDTKMYTPFVVITGTILNNTVAKNITISKGKVVDNGTKTLVAAVTCPGLQESLDLNEKDLEIPSKVELEFEATDFEMGNIMSYATPKIIEESDLDNLEKLDDLYSKMSTLDTSSTELVKGAKTLQDGVNKYVEKNTEFSSAMDSLQDGVDTINTNYGLLNDGVNELNNSASKLESGAEKLNSGVDGVSSGLNKLQNGVANGKEEAVSALTESANSLSEGIDMLIAGKEKETAKIKSDVIENGNETLKENLTSAVTEGSKKIASATLSAILNNEEFTTQYGIELTEQQKQALTQALAKNMDTSTLKTGISNAIDSATEKEKAGVDLIDEKGIKTSLTGLKQKANTSIQAGIKSISAGFDSISSGVDSINDGVGSLKDGTKELYQGTKKLTTGTSTLAQKSGMLQNGISTLNNSTIQINSANKQLLAGSQTIQSGMETLSNGIEKFDNEGIKEISKLVNGEVKDLQERIEALKKLADEYNNFAGIDEETDGTVKFILMTDSIKK